MRYIVYMILIYVIISWFLPIMPTWKKLYDHNWNCGVSGECGDSEPWKEAGTLVTLKEIIYSYYPEARY